LARIERTVSCSPSRIETDIALILAPQRATFAVGDHKPRVGCGQFGVTIAIVDKPLSVVNRFEQSLAPRRVCSGKLFPEVIDTCFDGFDLLDGALQLGPAAKLIGASQGELYVGE